MKHLIIIKIGSQILLDENENFDATVIHQIAEDIAHLRQKGYGFAIVSSGACALGKRILKGHDTSILTSQITASIGQPILMKTYQEIFSHYNIIVSQALLTRYDLGNKTTYATIQSVLEKEIDLGIIPIINENDVVATDEIVFSDNDQLAAFVAMMLRAKKLILLSNIRGLHTAHPDKGGTIIHQVEQIDDTVFGYVSKKKSEFGRGGMYSKLISAQTATNFGIEVILGEGRRKHIVRDILRDETVGTIFQKNEISRKKTQMETWIQAGAIPQGKIIVNACLADILKQKKRVSILEVGIIGTEGNFEAGDLIEVLDTEGNVMGKGLAKISKNAIKKHKIDEKSQVVIHTNYFVYT